MRIAAPALAAVLWLSACEKSTHDMYEQPKYEPLQSSTLFPDGRASQRAPTGTVPAATDAFAGAADGRPAPPVTAVSLARGRDRYDIYCAPCHSVAGDGDGQLVRRGFPAPPSYHSERLRSAPDSHFYSVISNGYGVMFPYADRLSPQDRWAIVGYIRALQLSRNAPLDRLAPTDRQALEQLP